MSPIKGSTEWRDTFAKTKSAYIKLRGGPYGLYEGTANNHS
jgi:hypothetical protein